MALPLLGGFSHRHPAGDLQPVRMIGDRRVLIASLETGVGNLLRRSDSRRSIRSAFGGRRVLLKLGPANAASDSMRRTSARLRNGAGADVAARCLRGGRSRRWPFDGRRLARLENLADDPCRTGPNSGDSR